MAGPSPSAGSAATRSRSGSRRARGASSGRGPRRGGGSGRTRRRRSLPSTMRARLGGEGVPDARALAVLGGRALDLVRRGAGTEPEARWKQRVRHGDRFVSVTRHRSSGFGTGSSTARVGTPDPTLLLLRRVLRPRRCRFGPTGRAQRRPARPRARGTTRTSTATSCWSPGWCAASWSHTDETGTSALSVPGGLAVTRAGRGTDPQRARRRRGHPLRPDVAAARRARARDPAAPDARRPI